MDFLYPVHNPDSNIQSTNTKHNSLAVHWFVVTDKTSLVTQLSGMYRLGNTVSLEVQSFTFHHFDCNNCVMTILKLFIKAFSPQ